MANNIYKMRFTETFFDEADIDDNIAAQWAVLPGGILGMENILLDFAGYIAQIGVRAFYQGDKPYEKTGQFLLTAWLYPFIKSLEELAEKERISEDVEELREAPAHKSVRREMARRAFLGWGCQPLTGLGRMDIFLTYKGNKYIIETKVNRYDIAVVLEEGIKQVAGKYLASEGAAMGYLVIFDTRTPVGATCKPQYRGTEDRKVTSFTIGIGRSGRPL